MFRNKKDKRNNKGFSLVELIVVIAIMAVLVAVLAPQFTKYIDQSRKSNDAATVSAVVTAAQVGITDLNYAVPEDTYTITFTASGTSIKKSDGSELTATDGLYKAVKDACGELNTLKITSKNWTGGTDGKSVVATVEYAGGAVKVTYSSDFATYVGGTATTP